jgi:uncharacterized SAM-dependent methyltransferase
MNTEVLLTEMEIAQEFTEAIEARDLPEKFFYWLPLSVRAWLELSRDAVYQDLRHTWNVVAERAPKIAHHFDRGVAVVSFGAGDGSKDRRLLETLRQARQEVKYFPVDASQALLETACSSAEDAEFEALGIKADISSPVHLVLAADAAESQKLFLMAGNTLGSFDPLDQVRHVAQCMHEGDRLIVDGEIYCEPPLTSADKPVMRKFAFAPLASLGISEDDGELRFEHKRDERHEGLHLITKQFRANRDLRVNVSGEEILVERGERIAMNFQYMYSPQAFRWLLAEHGRLKIVEEIPSPDGRFLAAVCSR